MGTRESKIVDKQKYYKNELKIKHGEEEFKELVADGTYSETTDKKGRKCYVRAHEIERTEDYEDKGTTAKHMTEMTEEEAEKLEDSMHVWALQNAGKKLSIGSAPPIVGKGDKKRKATKDPNEEPKPKKPKVPEDPLETARKKSSVMCRLLDHTSNRLLKAYNNIPTSKIAAGTKTALKDEHSSVESHRKELQQAGASTRATEKDLKKRIIKAAELVKETMLQTFPASQNARQSPQLKTPEMDKTRIYVKTLEKHTK